MNVKLKTYAPSRNSPAPYGLLMPWNWDWNIATNLLVFAMALILFGIGGRLLFKKEKIKEAGLALTVALFLVIVLSGARYKHFKGLGFEVDAWEQTEKQAQELVDRLALRSEVSAQQFSLLVARAGLWDSSLTNTELMEVLAQNKKVLETVNTSKRRQAEIIEPIVERIEKNYLFMAHDLALAAYQNEINNTQNEIVKASQRQAKLGYAPNPDPIISLNIRNEQLAGGREKVSKLSFDYFIKEKTISPIIDLVKDSVDFPGRKELVGILNELEDDLQFFTKNGELKEDVAYKDLAVKLGVPAN